MHALESFVGFCATALSNSQMFEQALLECRWSNVLLDLARTLFENLESIEQVVTNIMVNAAALLQCEKCSVFMVDFDSNELYARIFDVEANGLQSSQSKFIFDIPSHYMHCLYLFSGLTRMLLLFACFP